MIESKRFMLIFVQIGSINSGTAQIGFDSLKTKNSATPQSRAFLPWGPLGCTAQFRLKRKQAKGFFCFALKRKNDFFFAFLHASETLQKGKKMKAKHFKERK
jgi:hypothetical protein